MRKQNRVLKIIAGNSGASLMFVLAIMLLLMAVGTSVLVSASSNMNAGINKQLENRLNIYADSMHRAILSSLKSASDETRYIGGGGIGDYPATLSGQILGALYSGASGSATEEDIPVSLTINCSPSFYDGRIPSVTSTVEIVVNALVRITPYEAGQLPEDIKDEAGTVLYTIPEILEQPQSAVINGSATVTITATLPAGLAEKSVISVVTYNFTSGFLKEDAGKGGLGDMQVIDSGDWRFISRERVDFA